MKKYLFIMSAAALVMASCSEDQELVNAPASQENRVLTATFEQEAATRTSIDGDNNNALTWSTEDAIAVFGTGDGEQAEYNLTAGGGTGTATFTRDGGSTAPAEIAGAAFPYSQAVSFNYSEGMLEMNLLAELDQISASELDLPMWGTVADGNIAFKHLAGVLKVNLTGIPEDYTKLIVTASNPINGNFTADINVDDEYPVLTSESTEAENKTVTVEFDNGETATLYLPLPVGTYESIEVSVSDENGAKTKVLKKFSNITVERTKVYKTTVSDYTSVMTEEELVAAIAAGGDVTLGASFTVTKRLNVSAGTTVNLNLNNKTLTIEGDALSYGLVNRGNMTIKDGTIDFKGNAEDNGAAVCNLAQMTLSSVSITSNSICFRNFGEEVPSLEGKTAEDATITATITGGTFTSSFCKDGAHDTHRYAVHAYMYSNMTMTGSTVSGSGGVSVDVSFATLDNVTAEHTCTYGAHDLYVPCGNATVTDCTFNNAAAFSGSYNGGTDYGKAVVNGMTYENGTTGIKFVSTPDAFVSAVATGGSVILNENIELNEVLTITGGKVSLNLNGKTLTGNVEDYCMKNSGDLTIFNGYITTQGGAVITTGGNLMMTDCEVTLTGSKWMNAVEVKGGTAEITGGSYKSTGTLAVDERTDWYGIGIVNGTVTLNTTVEGTFCGGVTLAPESGNRPKVTITGGSYSGQMYHGLNLNGGDLTLNGEMKFSGKGGDIRVYTLTGTINGVCFGSEGDKTYTLEELMNIINSKKGESVE